MPDVPNPRATIGLALIGSAAMILVLAVLFGAGVLDLADDTRPTVVAALVAVAVLDIVIGLWFLRRSQ